ncbi:lysozyme [Agrobacterium tumefaciens]|jgi:GH24 family phage-related lysozyme (muramidase)|nr:lysozyme [Agrobacterium tumefaciens]
MANRQTRNPGQLARFDMSAGIGDAPSFAVNTGQAAEALANVAGSLSDTLGKMAARAAQREGEIAGLTAGQDAGGSYLQQTQANGVAAGVAGTGPWHEQAKALLRKEEGFRETPYWDVNAHRVGYGSDTTVTADGKVVKVTQGMKITRDDAERDLDYRLTKREGFQVQKQLGDTWNKLPEGAKAALASVGYNYGSLPKEVVAAAKTGNLEMLSSAVAGLSSNKARRQREAAMILAKSPTSTAAEPDGKPTGLLEKGNIDLTKRPVVKNSDGTISTVRSLSFEEDGREVLIPTVSEDGKVMSDDAAVAAYRKSGKHLGKFDTAKNATTFAENLHGAQSRFYQQAGVEPQLSTAPLALRRDGTIRGEAFDNAALSAWGWRMQEGVSNDLYAAQQQHEEDPAGYAAAAQEIRKKYVAELPADPKVREMFDKSFANQNQAYVRNINAKYETKLRGEQLASFSSGYSSRLVDLERQAQVLGANPEGDAIIAEQTTSFQRSIDGAVAQGILTPAQAEKYKIDVATTSARGRIQGVYDALPTPEQKEAFATDLLNDWKEQKGPLAALPYDTVKGISNTLFNDAREQINRRTASNKAEKVRIDALIEDDVASIAATGKGLDPSSSGLDPAKVGEIVGPEGMQKWRLGQDRANRIYAATNGMEVQSTSDLNQRLTLMKPEAGKPGYADELEIYEAARKRAQDVLKERQTDPLGQAARGGAIDVQPIDANSAEELSRTLTLRKTQRDQVAGLYQQQVPVFRPGEKEALSAAILRRPEMLPAFAISIQQAFGNEAPRVLSEISEDGPIIAHAAGLSLASGDTSIANDVADTLANKREKVYTAKMPAQGDMSNFANGEIAGAMYADPRTQSAIVQTASILFEQMANQHGFDATDLKTEGSIARAAFARAIDRAAGARTIGDKTFGGLAEVNGARIIVPSDMEKERPARLLAGLSQAQMEKLPPIDSSNEFKIPIEKVRQAKLVSVGDGLYRVALNDPLSDDPKYLRGAGGTFWTLNIRQLDEVSKTTRSADEDLDLTPWTPL